MSMGPWVDHFLAIPQMTTPASPRRMTNRQVIVVGGQSPKDPITFSDGDWGV